MTSAATRLWIFAAIAALGVWTAQQGFADPERPTDEAPCSAPIVQPVGQASLMVLNADESPLTIRKQLSAKVTALLAMTKTAKGEKCAVIVTARSPKVQYSVVKAKSSK